MVVKSLGWAPVWQSDHQTAIAAGPGHPSHRPSPQVLDTHYLPELNGVNMTVEEGEVYKTE